MKLVPYIKDKLSYLREKRSFPFLLFSAFILFIFLINTVHESYPDEFDNILGGWYQLQGLFIYKDWFTHHGPTAYFLSSLVEVFSGRSFFGFRIVYSVFLFIFMFATFGYLRRSIKSISVNFYSAFILIFAFAATYFWGHMVLADNISAILLTPVLALVFLKMYQGESFTLKDFIFMSILSSLAILSSLTFIFLLIFLYFFVGLHYLKTYDYNLKKVFNPFTYKIVGIIFAPYLIFLVYLLITGSLNDFIYQAIIFNKKYYVYYPGSSGEVSINPLRFAIVIAQEFHNNFSSLLIQASSFNFSFPFNISLAVSNTILLIYLVLKRKYTLALFVLFWFVFSNARSNPLTSKETDYQSSVYIVASLFGISFIIPTLYEELKRDIEYPKKLVLSFLFVILIIYSFFNFSFLLRKFSYKAYDKYMGRAGLIYDRPRIAPILNAITAREEYAMIGPFEFEENFYLNAKQPSKYHILLPGMGSSEKIQQELVSDLGRSKPSVIYFDRRFFILGRSPEMTGQFFLSYLDQNYTTLSEYKSGSVSYKSKIPIDDRVDIETKLYIDKNKVPQIVQRLLEEDLIEAK